MTIWDISFLLKWNFLCKIKRFLNFFRKINNINIKELCVKDKKNVVKVDYIFALTGWEYCKFKDGKSANQTECKNAQKTFLKSLNKNKEANNNEMVIFYHFF